MKLYPNPIEDDGIRSWRGRRQHYLVLINEVFNHELGYVDKYTYRIIKRSVFFDYESPTLFDTVELCKNDAIKKIDGHRSMLRNILRLERR